MLPYFENKSDYIFVSHRPNSYNFPSHFHSHTEIAYCFSGSQRVKVGEKIYTLHKGDAVMIFPNKVHEYIKYDFQGGESTESVSIICNTRLLSDIIPDIISKDAENPFIPSELISKTTAFAFRKISEKNDNVESIGWTYVILSSIMKNLELTEQESNLGLPSEILSYIDANFREQLSINHIAKVFGYHPSYIAHIFCDRLGISFRTYLGGVRSEYVASQIRTTGKSLTEIAYEAGYNSLNTFCRAFKKHFSQTPSEYKKKMKME